MSDNPKLQVIIFSFRKHTYINYLKKAYLICLIKLFSMVQKKINMYLFGQLLFKIKIFFLRRNQLKFIINFIKIYVEVLKKRLPELKLPLMIR